MISDKNYLEFLYDFSVESDKETEISEKLDAELMKNTEQMNTDLIEQYLDELDMLYNSEATVIDKSKISVRKENRFMKKRLIYGMVALFAVIITVSLVSIFADDNKSVMKEISLSDYENYLVSTLRAPFDREDVLTGNGNSVNTVTFKGKVLDIKLYDVSWTDDKNENWGPFKRTFLTVQVNEIYDGVLSKNKRNVIIGYSSIINAEQDSVKIIKDKEYVFIGCWNIDEKYFDYAEEQDSSLLWKNDPTLKEADLMMGGAWYSACPVKNGNVTVYNAFFEGEDISDKIIDISEEDSNEFIEPRNIENGVYITLSESDFKQGLIELTEKFTKSEK